MKYFSNILMRLLLVVICIAVVESCKRSKIGADITYTLQISEKTYLIQVSENNKDSLFWSAIILTDSILENTNGNYFEIFEKSITTLDSTHNIVQYFQTRSFSNRISSGMSNSEVLAILKTDFNKLVDETIQVLEKRLNDCNLSEFKISRSNQSGLIIAELKGVEYPERLKIILQKQGDVLFYETYDNIAIFPILEKIDKMVAEKFDVYFPDEFALNQTKTDTTDLSKKNIVVSVDINTGQTDAEKEELEKNSPFFSILQPEIDKDKNGHFYISEGPVVGHCSTKDTGRVNELLAMPLANNYFPIDIFFVWVLTNFQDYDGAFLCNLVALRTRSGEPAMNGEYIIDARGRNLENGKAEIQFEMNSEGAKIWQRITRKSIGFSIAIFIDGKLHSYPTVVSEITNGQSSISGEFTEEEAIDLALILKYRLPISIQIVDEKVVKNSQ